MQTYFFGVNVKLQQLTKPQPPSLAAAESVDKIIIMKYRG